nr:histidine kinase [Bacteroidia bacterium]
SDWIETKDVKQVFPNLPSGKYVFRVRTSIDPQFTFNNERIFSFEIKKPFWSEDWFYIISVLLTILLVYFFIRLRDARMKKLQQLKNDSIRFQFETLRNQVNPHFLFNSFNTLIDIIEHDKEHAVEYVENLSAFFRNIVTYKDKDTIKLSEEIKIVKAFYFIQQKRFGSNLQLLVDEHSLYDDRYVVPMVLQLLLENAIKHNEISKEKNLKVKVSFSDSRIIISNNTNPKMNKDESTGTGLRNIIARYRLLTDKTVQIESSQEYFVVSLPLIIRE